MEAWFISDIHLKSVEERNGKILLRFLHSLLARNPKEIHLFMLGDIFDLWVGPHDFFAEKFHPIINAIHDLKKAGAQVTYIEGNHDVHIEGFFKKKLGVDVFVEAQYLEIDGIKLRLEHGDLINLEDHKYLKYRSIIRNPYIKPLGSIIPGSFWNRIGEKASKKSRARSSHYARQNSAELVEMIRNHTLRAFAQTPFDMIISGHMHVFLDEVQRIEQKNVRTVNLGSWFEDRVRVFCLKHGLGEWIYLDNVD